MKPANKIWTKEELKIYILLLCAKADSEESELEISLIKSKTSETTFEQIYAEFSLDDEDKSIEKIEFAVGRHEYSMRELYQLKKEIQEIFTSDKKYLMKERSLGSILDNILY